MDELSRARAVATMAPAWIVALAGAIVVGVTAGESYLTWLPVVMAATVLVAFAVQLIVGMRRGLVARLGGSVSGGLAILLVTTAALLLARPEGLHILV